MVNTLRWKPYHFAKDLIVSSGDTGEIQAKFDYGSVFHKDLEGEWVDGFIYKQGWKAWQEIGSFLTNGDGKIYFDDFPQEPGEYALKFVVRGDLSQASGRLTVSSRKQAAVLFDLDGTLTLNDFEIVKDYLNIRDAKPYPGVPELINFYQDLDYQIVYLTARPYITMPATQEWFGKLGIPRGHLYSPISFEESLDQKGHAQFKADYINYLQDHADLDLKVVYGNADTDIMAYEMAGIDKSRTFIIGENAGNEGTRPIRDGYFDHINRELPQLDLPANQCT